MECRIGEFAIHDKVVVLRINRSRRSLVRFPSGGMSSVICHISTSSVMCVARGMKPPPSALFLSLSSSAGAGTRMVASFLISFGAGGKSLTYVRN